ncbi:MAG: ATP-binding protein [Clostridia bacterium]|nr:ATP-binding protein [Clostridia bacterium]
MNHEVLKQVIQDQHEVIRNARIVPRNAYVFDPGANYILTGLRRSGKSTLLYHMVQKMVHDGVLWEQIIYINFEDERLAGFTTADFNDIVAVQSEMSNLPGYYFFDEIQNISAWEKFARRMADSKEHVFITGSNAKMLSRDMETTLGGRYLSRQVRPYSFEEYLTARNIAHTGNDWIATKSRAKIVSALDDFLREGGLPESLQYMYKREYISSVFQKVLLGDIIARHGIRNEYAVKMLIKKIAETVKDEMSYSRLHGALTGIGVKISKDSVIDYLHYAEEAYLLFPVRNWVSKFSDRESTPKYYLSDNGILNLFLTNKGGILLENMTAVELNRLFGEEVYYLKSEKTGIDVDFFLPEQGIAIQVCMDLNDLTSEREIGNLVRLSKNMQGIKHLLVVTRDPEQTTRTIDDCRVEMIPSEQLYLSISQLAVK